MPDGHTWAAIAVMALATAALRFLPFLIWGGGRKPPKLVEKLGRTLPCAVIAMLLVYCLKDLRFAAPAGYLPQLISCAVTAALYLWRRNTLLGIVGGTLCCMALTQLAF